MKEAIQMSDESLTIEQVLKDVGWIDKWEARCKLEVARNLKTFGDSPEKIQTVTGLSAEEIAKL